jgi:3D (Asp-Asp-Asp) domain-containing protein
VITEQQLLAEEELRKQEQKDKDLNETMAEWFITRMEWLGRIKYRLGHFSEEENKFDCSWLFKAYALRRGLLSEEEAGYINSTVLYLLATPKKLSQAKRWDITYRSPLWDETLKHLAMVTRDYDPSEWWIRIIDNAPENNWKVEERFIQMRGDVFIGRRKILIGTNPFVEIAKNKWLEYAPINEYLGMYQLSRYYTPVPGQANYFLWSYEADFAMNCSWDCTITANGTKLNTDLVEKIVACPPTYPMWTKLMIEDWIQVTCADRGWSIKGNRLDIRAGIGEDGYNNIKNNEVVTGRRNIYKKTLHSKPTNETKIRLYIINSSGGYVYR